MVEQISTPEGYDVMGFQDGPAALEAARKIVPRLIIADYHLENMTFSGFCKEVHRIEALADTYIISLIGAGDRLDESHLKSLGVKAFLKKPFQTENLLDIIKELEQSSATKGNGAKATRRVWPPVSSSTDSDDDEAIDGLGEEDQTGEIEIQPLIPASTRKAAPMAQNPVSKPAATDPEEAMKGLFGQLLQSMTEKTETKIAALLPQVIGKDLAAQVAKAVETEVHHQLGASLSPERLADIVEPLLANELPKVLSRELATLEPIIRHSIFEIADPLIKDSVARLIRDQMDGLKITVPEAIRDRLTSMEGEFREEIKKAAAAQAEQHAEALIRDTAKHHVQQIVEQVVPKIAEEQVTTEIRRLSEAA
jgi:CheY-like chemotaxis protein